jgi:hypothetical protein
VTQKPQLNNSSGEDLQEHVGDFSLLNIPIYVNGISSGALMILFTIFIMPKLAPHVYKRL